jgi:membrane protease YdiL (CAAX protease family)
LNRSDTHPSSDFLRVLASPVLHAFAVFFAVWILSQHLSPRSSDNHALLRSDVLQLVLVLALPAVASRMAGLQLIQVFRLRSASVRNVLLTAAATPGLIFLLDEIRSLQICWTGQENNLVEQFLQTASIKHWIELILSLAVVPAVCEEALFRGYLLDRLSTRDQAWRAIMISSVLFGLFHRSLQLFLPAVLSGIFFAFLTMRTGSLINSIVSHFLVNAWAIVAVNSNLPVYLDWIKYPEPARFLLLAIALVGIFLMGKLLEKTDAGC